MTGRYGYGRARLPGRLSWQVPQRTRATTQALQLCLPNRPQKFFPVE